MQGSKSGHLPANFASKSCSMSLSKILRSFQTSTTLFSLAWTSTGAPLYATAVASAMKGENALTKSSLWRALDCCVTSIGEGCVSTGKKSQFAASSESLTSTWVSMSRPSENKRALTVCEIDHV